MNWRRLGKIVYVVIVFALVFIGSMHIAMSLVTNKWLLAIILFVCLDISAMISTALYNIKETIQLSAFWRAMRSQFNDNRSS
jgi:glucan phosphoethanolaminetransferase (alkaline phosphatase superfamily)